MRFVARACWLLLSTLWLLASAFTGAVARASDSPPVIVSQPQNQTNAVGTTASFTVSASASGTITYQWQKNGVALSDGGNVSGSGTTNLVLSNVGTSDAAGYAAVASNAGGSATSAVATLTVVLPPAITTQPASQNVLYGAPATLSVAATGIGLNYQWYLNGSPISGATTSTLSLTGSYASGGNYTVVMTNVAGSVTSSVALFGVFSQAGPAYAFTNFAGQPGGLGNADGTGSNARFYYPSGVAVDSAGNVYVADNANSTIRKVTPAGVVTTLAGSAGSSGTNDGVGSAARFSSPNGVAVDSAGNVYVADTGNQTIRKVTPAGVVTTLAGSPGQTGSSDGTGSSAKFSQPFGVAVDSAGNVYVADYYNDTIRKVTPAGVVTTLAGSPGQTGSSDGTGSNARFYYPRGVAVDSAGNVYVADYYNSTIRKVTPAGVVTTLAGSPRHAGSSDGTGSNARFFWPYGVAVDSAGNVYVADTGNSTIRKVTPAGVVTTLAGSPGQSGSSDGTGSNARFDHPMAWRWTAPATCMWPTTPITRFGR